VGIDADLRAAECHTGAANAYPTASNACAFDCNACAVDCNAGASDRGASNGYTCSAAYTTIGYLRLFWKHLQLRGFQHARASPSLL
jgi:Tfp pilus assembly protein PilX